MTSRRGHFSAGKRQKVSQLARSTREILCVAVLAAAGLGWLSSRQDSPKWALVVVLAAALSAVMFMRPGVAIGGLLVGVLNGLPGIDTAETALLGLALRNYCAYLLIVVLATQALRTRSSRVEPYAGRLLTVAGALIAAWWSLTVIRSGGAGVPLGAAAAYGRNYLVFAFLVVLFPFGLRRERDRQDAIAVVAVATMLFSVGVIVVTVTGASLSWLVHVVAIRTSESGLPRIYAYMEDAGVLTFCAAIGVALFGWSPRQRLGGIVLASVTGAALVLQQTRAILLTVPLAILFVAAVFWVLVPQTRTRMTGRAAFAVIATVSLFALVAVLEPVSVTYGARAISRLGSTASEFTTGTGNIGLRLNVAQTLVRLLGGDLSYWLTGLGFLDPAYRYFPGLPQGSINNSDLGFLSGVMLIGLVGVAMVYTVAGLAFWRVASIARRWTSSIPLNAWLAFGTLTWIAQVFLASYSLGTLFQIQGEALLAFVVGIAVTAFGYTGSAVSQRESKLRSTATPRRASAATT
jgi:hypothetical protein